jgi:hypothetical protein
VNARRNLQPFSAAGTGAAALACVLAALGAGCARETKDFPAPVVGVELPLAGRDAVDGLHAREGIELALSDWNLTHKPFIRVRYRDSAPHLQNAHEDEGQDPVDEPARAATIAADFARDAAVVVMIGGLRHEVAAAERAATLPAGLALVSGGVARGIDGSLFAVDPSLLAHDASFVKHFHHQSMEMPTPEALRFYAATVVALDAVTRSDGSRKGVRAVLAAHCPHGACPAPSAVGAAR